ncbi:cyclase family protein [Rhodococcus opacus]|uniref:Cyclase n=1 Tax=Rhodococcus opacus TaxID=37919 RepID=A0A2S8J8T6_RHOOP|nr:cyclase family protein [Rhodococcus opacus]PQP23415.1 cyclase [Rhodococcus opacus]
MTDDWRQVADRVRNWGRWGADDQLGTLNYITQEKISSAARLARRGVRFNLSIPVDAYGPQSAHGYRRNPVHMMTLDGGDADMSRALETQKTGGGAQEAEIIELWKGPMRYTDDFIVMPLQSGTQWDGLAHVYYDDRLYNDHPAASVTSAGAMRNGIEHVGASGGVMGRGVLLDVARHCGVRRLEPDVAIGPNLLDEVADSQGVAIEEGDILLIRTGWWTHFLDHRDGATWQKAAPGVSWKVAEWLHERRVAAIAADNIAVERRTPEIDNHVLLFHMLTIRDMGMTLGEIWDLEALAQDCAGDGVYEFFLSATPLLVTGAVGSPVTPVAIK